MVLSTRASSQGDSKVRSFTQLSACPYHQCRAHAIDETAFSIGEVDESPEGSSPGQLRHTPVQCVELRGQRVHRATPQGPQGGGTRTERVLRRE